MNRSNSSPQGQCTQNRPHANGRLGARVAPLALAVIALTASCFHGSRPPSVSPKGTLAPGGDDAALLPSQKPFGVVFGSPQGEVREAAEVNIVFNRPMRPLDLAGGEAKAPVVMTPVVAGEWHWIGTNALLFAPAKHLPRATQFAVEVPAGTRAMDGSSLAQPWKLAFNTARPELVNTTPGSDEDHLTPTTRFRLEFNQPIETSEISRAVKLTHDGAKGAKEIAFDVVRPDAQNQKLAELAPKRPLPLDSDIELLVDASLKGAEGPLPAGKPGKVKFRTYGPLEVEQLSCSRDTPNGRCAPRSSLTLVFSNAIKLADARKAITVTPAVKLSWPEGGEDYRTRYVHLSAPYAPAGKYTVRVRGDVADTYGQKLGKDAALEASFDDLWPTAEIGVTGTYFDAKAVRDIAVASVNLRTLELSTLALDEEAVGRFEWERNLGFDQIAAMSGARTSRLHPSVAPNATVKQLVRPSEVLGGAQKRGPMAIAIRYTSRPNTRQARPVNESRIVQITDLGITGKLSRFGSLIWVTRLSDGHPVAGAEVRVRKPGAPPSHDLVYKTDQDGLAQLPADAIVPTHDERKAPIVFVRSGDDWAYRNTGELFYGWRYGVSTDLSGKLSPFGMAFTERGVYRPGDTVKLKTIVRTPEARGTSTPANGKVHVRVSGPTGDAVLDQVMTLNEFGSLATDVVVPRSAPLGTYDAEVLPEPQGDLPSIAMTTFEVAEYRPSEFKVSVESSQPSYIRGDRAQWIARGDYLFGAPMAKAKARTTVTRSETYFAIPGLEDFSISDETYGQDVEERTPRGGQVHSGEAALDDKGVTNVEALLAMPGQSGTENVTCETEVMDLSRQTVASSSTAIVHPAEFYVALRTPKDELFVKAGEELAVEALAVEPNGRRRSGVKIDVELIQRSWVTARLDAGSGGYRTASRRKDEVVGSCSVTSAGEPQGCKLEPKKGGYYLLRAKAQDPRKNPVAASRGVYVLGEGSGGWADGDDSGLEIVPDRKSYEVGQTAKLLVKSPFATADALITVERSGIYKQQRVQLQGPMPTIQIPITDELRPNAYVSVVLVRGRTKAPPAQWNAADVGSPAFRMGYVNLTTNPEARRLGVEVKTPRKEYRPGERVEVELLAKDRAGKGVQTEITLYAVDEGVLMLTGYKTPDPVPAMLGARPLQVGFTESRADLARLTLSPLGGVVGGDKGLEGGGGGGIRQNFAQSAYFNPSVVTDEAGRARVSFQLPDSLTTWRIMAVAAAKDDRFGYGESRVVTNRPIMARPAFPRFLRAGDQFQAGVIVTSKGLPKGTFQVQLDSSGIELAGPARQDVELEPGQSKEVAFAFRAASVGDAKFRFRVEGSGEKDAVEFGKKISPPTWMESVALYGETRAASGDKLGNLEMMRPDVGGLELTVASTALVGLGGSVEQLIEYPYLCTEQLTSRLVPLVALRDLAKDFQLDMPKNADTIVANTVADIVKRQRGDGGFGMWPDSDTSNVWASTYALWGLGMASRRGVPVPQRSLDSATEYVRGYLSRWDRQSHGRAAAAFMLDVLAENGTPDPGYMNRLFAEREKFPLFARAQLLHAMAVGKGDEPAREQLQKDVEAGLRIDGNKAVVAENLGDEYAVYMDSSTRTNALVLRALIASKPGHPLAGRLVRGLLEDRKGGKWSTTQESAYALLSIDEFRKAQERDVPDFVAQAWLGDHQILDTPMSGRSTSAVHGSVAPGKVAASSGSVLAFQMTGNQKGTLYYEARLTYAKKELPAIPLDRGFFVQKSMRIVTPQALESTIRTVPAPGARFPDAKGGDLVLVDLVIVSPHPQDYVVIDDPIPAGLEAVNSRFATTAASTFVSASGGEDETVDDSEDEDSDEGYNEERDRLARGDAWFDSWFRQEIRDDRVLYFVDHMGAGMFHYRYLARATTPGVYMLPPTKAEAMYHPEVFGRTAGASFRVTP